MKKLKEYRKAVSSLRWLDVGDWIPLLLLLLVIGLAVAALVYTLTVGMFWLFALLWMAVIGYGVWNMVQIVPQMIKVNQRLAGYTERKEDDGPEAGI